MVGDGAGEGGLRVCTEEGVRFDSCRLFCLSELDRVVTLVCWLASVLPFQRGNWGGHLRASSHAATVALPRVNKREGYPTTVRYRDERCNAGSSVRKKHRRGLTRPFRMGVEGCAWWIG